MNVYLTSTVKLNLAIFHSGGTEGAQHANPAFSTNMFGHTVVGRHLPERYAQTKCALRVLAHKKLIVCQLYYYDYLLLITLEFYVKYAQ